MTINLPEKVRYIISTLTEHGYEAYAVGGCVRDSLLGRKPGDWDITTSAFPEETKALFPKTFDTGIEHGTITVLLDREGFEVTTYRIDGEYEDNRHPKEVTFTRSLKEDLLRRDFTINAMAYNDHDGLVDIFHGQEDLEKKRIRCVGNATQRFSEDALRILRAIRFAGQLGFEIEDDTRAAMRELAGNLADISAERIQAEIMKLLVSDHPERLRDAYELGITRVVLPEFDAIMHTEQETRHHCYNVGEHTIHALQNIPADRVLRLTMLLHDMGKPGTKTIDEEGQAHFIGHALLSKEIAGEILHRLKFDNETIRRVLHLVRYHDYRMPGEPKAVRKAMSRVGEEAFPDYLLVRRADILAQSMYRREEKLLNLEEVEACGCEIRRQGQCVSLKELAVKGNDLIEAGVPRGPRIGEILEELLQIVLEEPEKNDREYLLSISRQMVYNIE